MLSVRFRSIGLNPPKPINFIKTKRYKQFSEFCRACQRDKTIGLCYGSAGVEKTESAREYTKWYKVHQLIEEYPSSFPDEVPFSMKNMHSILYTPILLDSAKEIFYAIEKSSRNFTLLKERALYGLEIPFEARNRGYELTKLVIIDEAEKLKS